MEDANHGRNAERGGRTSEEETSLPTILLIEQDQHIAFCLRLLLRRAGFRMTHVVWASEGLHLARTCSPSAVVLEVDLPDQDGVEVCRQLKAHSPTAGLPILFCSSYTESAEATRQVGAAGFLTKPDGVGQLVPLLLELLPRGSTTG